MTRRRAECAAALEEWADAIDPGDLVEADTTALKRIADLAEQRQHLDGELAEAVHEARANGRSWSEIGAMLGVSKQAAQRRYSRLERA